MFVVRLSHYFLVIIFLFCCFPFFGELPNVLFLTVDTLRANHLGCYGYPFPTSPNIDKLAEKGLVFDNCIAEVPLTCPSFTSMLTSRYPRSIGTTRNGLGISKGIVTVPELFKQQGYFTFCVQSNWTLKSQLSGLHKGFDVYDDDFHTKRWGLFAPERLANEVVEKAIDYLNKRPKGVPFFGWIHFSDPHAPYHLRDRYNPHREINKMVNKKHRTIVSYDSEVNYVDVHIGRLLQYIPDNTEILFVADHGESLYEHGYLGHGRKLYQNEVRIPLILVSKKVNVGRSNMPVRGIDIGPTLLALANIPKPEFMLGESILRNDLWDKNIVRVIETYGGAVPRFPLLRLLMKNKGPIKQAVIVEDWKLIVSGRKVELFNLAEDTEEVHNLAKKYSEKVTEYLEHIKTFNKNYPRNINTHTQLSSEDIRILKSMGYLD